MSRPKRFVVSVEEQPLEVELEAADANGTVRAKVGESWHQVTRAPDDSWVVRPEGGGAAQRVWLDRAEGRPGYAGAAGVTAPLEVVTAAEAALRNALLEVGGGAGAAGAVKAPMPGRVVKALVSEGESVEAGQAVIIVEAMKMENEVTAAGAGVIKRVAVSAGDTVDAGELLIEIEPHPDA